MTVAVAESTSASHAELPFSENYTKRDAVLSVLCPHRKALFGALVNPRTNNSTTKIWSIITRQVNTQPPLGIRSLFLII
jgi:hypothetical protein